MATEQQLGDLRSCYEAALAAGHIWPEMASCEAMLESSWMTSQLAVGAFNIFGQKQSHPPAGESLTLPTQEYLHGAWITVSAVWKKYADLHDCFEDRMALLERLAPAYPHYRAALAATTAEQYVTEVSQSWSTDTQRAEKVLEIYRAHQDVFA